MRKPPFLLPKKKSRKETAENYQQCNSFTKEIAVRLITELLVHLIPLLWLDETNEKIDQAFPTWASRVLLLLAKPEFSVSILPDLPKKSSAVIKLNQNQHWSKSWLIFSQLFHRDEFFLTQQIASDLGKSYYISSYDHHSWSMLPPLPLLKRYLDTWLLGVVFIKLHAWNKRMTARKKQQLKVGKICLRWGD